MMKREHPMVVSGENAQKNTYVDKVYHKIGGEAMRTIQSTSTTGASSITFYVRRNGKLD